MSTDHKHEQFVKNVNKKKKEDSKKSHASSDSNVSDEITDPGETIDQNNFSAAEESLSFSSQQKLQAEVEKWKNDFLYLRAEFDNYKKQSIKERSDLIKYGSERLILSLLDVLDVFDKALSIEVTAQNLESFVKGVRLTSEELRHVLSRFGLSASNPKGEAFDPAQHEAVSTEATKEYAPGHITQVFRLAYKLHDRLIRAAQVVVAKEPPTSTKPTDHR